MLKIPFERNSFQLHFEASREFINSQHVYWYSLLDINMVRFSLHLWFFLQLLLVDWHMRDKIYTLGRQRSRYFLWKLDLWYPGYQSISVSLHFSSRLFFIIWKITFLKIIVHNNIFSTIPNLFKLKHCGKSGNQITISTASYNEQNVYLW